MKLNQISLWIVINRLFIDYKNLYIYNENYPQGHTIFINIHLLMKSYINTHDENISQEFGHLRGLRLPYYRQFLSSPIMRELLKKLN